jgi:AcrR family transcriptional regulator
MSKPSSIREQKRNFTRSQLKEAARDVFTQKGYLAATVDDIAFAAGASRATFYLHFPGKDAVAAEIIEENARLSIERYHRLDELVTSSAPDRPALLRAWLQEWVEHWRTNGSLMHAQMATAVSDPEKERKSLERGFTYLDAMPRFFEGLEQAQREETRAHAFILELMTRVALDATARSLLEIPDAAVLDFLTELWAGVFLPEA